MFCAIIMVLIMVPNFIYAARFKNAENRCKNKAINIIEQIGRYGCFALMIVNLGIKEFAFRSSKEFVIWLTLTVAFLLAYYVFWALFFKKQTKLTSIMLAVLPCLVFLTSGIIFRHWLLLIFTAVFAFGHIYVTLQNAPKD